MCLLMISNNLNRPIVFLFKTKGKPSPQITFSVHPPKNSINGDYQKSP